MLMIPRSTAEIVAQAVCPASAGAATVTGRSASGSASAGASMLTSTRRPRRSIGTCAMPTARAGVTFSSADPPRNTRAVM